MNRVVGVLRMAYVVMVIVLGLVLVFLVAWLPTTIRRTPPALWIAILLVRLVKSVFNIKVHCTDVGKLRRHEGFIFLNHLSYLEPLALLSLTPVRFLAADEVRRHPIIGWMAAAAGTLFVRREDKQARAAARRSIVETLSRSGYPPLVVFPEGKLGLGDAINPFHYGIFASASQHRIPYLLCAVQYSRPDIAIWRGALGEGLVTAVWRLATFRGRMEVNLYSLATVYPTPQDNPQELADAARHAIAEKLGLPENP